MNCLHDLEFQPPPFSTTVRSFYQHSSQHSARKMTFNICEFLRTTHNQTGKPNASLVHLKHLCSKPKGYSDSRRMIPDVSFDMKCDWWFLKDDKTKLNHLIKPYMDSVTWKSIRMCYLHSIDGATKGENFCLCSKSWDALSRVELLSSILMIKFFITFLTSICEWKPIVYHI